MFTTSSEAKKAGYFSRRYQTSEAHDAAARARDEARAAKMARAKAQNDKTAMKNAQAMKVNLAALEAGAGQTKKAARAKKQPKKLPALADLKP